jgi:OmpA family
LQDNPVWAKSEPSLGRIRAVAMALRWTAAGMMEAAKGFRRLKAYEHLPVLRAALALINPSTSSNELNKTEGPHLHSCWLHGCQRQPTYNQGLSERRADAVRQLLSKEYGIEAGNLVTVGYGLSHLKDPANPFAAENRRVQVINAAEK